MDEPVAPFEVELCRYEAGEITVEDVVEWIANHKWTPYRYGDSLNGFGDAWSGPQPDAFPVVSDAVLDRRLPRSIFKLIDARMNDTTSSPAMEPAGRVDGDLGTGLSQRAEALEALTARGEVLSADGPARIDPTSSELSTLEAVDAVRGEPARRAP